MAYDTRHTKLERVHHIYLMRLLIEYAKDKIGYDAVLAFKSSGFKRNKKLGLIS